MAQRQCAHACDTLRVVSLSLFEHHCDRVKLMTEWVCRWKPLCIPRGDTFQKAYLQEWERVDDGQSHVPSKTCQTGPPERQNLKSYRRLTRTSGTPLEVIVATIWRTKHTIKYLETYIVSRKRRTERSTNKSRTVWKKNYLHVNVK